MTTMNVHLPGFLEFVWLCSNAVSFGAVAGMGLGMASVRYFGKSAFQKLLAGAACFD